VANHERTCAMRSGQQAASVGMPMGGTVIMPPASGFQGTPDSKSEFDVHISFVVIPKDRHPSLGDQRISV